MAKLLFFGVNALGQENGKPLCDVTTMDLDESLRKLDRTAECFRKISSDPKLELRIPRKGCLPGLIVKHVFEVVAKILEQQSPVVFKFGFTHCPHFRFRNTKFGYAVDPHQKWQVMCILFASHESTGPAFLERL